MQPSADRPSAPVTRRSYDQFCGLAAALDLVGDRWTLLVVRELMTGPKRYGDLIAGLPGIGTSLLAQRLRQLETNGVLSRRAVPPPTPATLYELTAAGHDLGRALMPLATWGVVHALAPQRAADHPVRAAWSLLPFVYGVEDGALEGLDGVYAIEVDGDVADLVVAGGVGRVAVAGTSGPPAAVFVLSAQTATDIWAGRLDAHAAAADGRLRIDGDLHAAARLLEALPRP